MRKAPTIKEQVVLPPGGNFSAEMHAGERLRIIEVDGQQVADLISFNRADPREQLSMYCSRAVNRTWKLTAPHKLYSNLAREMWQIEEDSLGENYCGGGYCSRHMNLVRYGEPGASTCEDNLAAAVARFGLDRWSFNPDTCFNVFMTVAYEPNGLWEIRGPQCKAGDAIQLRALMPQMVAVSNCPQVLNPVNAGRLKPLQVEVLG